KCLSLGPASRQAVPKVDIFTGRKFTFVSPRLYPRRQGPCARKFRAYLSVGRANRKRAFPHQNEKGRPTQWIECLSQRPIAGNQARLRAHRASASQDGPLSEGDRSGGEFVRSRLFAR